jgi:protein-S-isoprenylcysteine O-methyltransferase Ste14
VHWGCWCGRRLLLAVYAPVIRREREFVRARFPEAYGEWERHVPAFVPRVTPWRGRGTGHVAADAPPFDLRLYLFHREWQAALGFAAVIAWLAYWTWRRGG